MTSGRNRKVDAAGTDAFRDFERAGWQNAARAYHDLWGSLTQQSVEPMLDALAVSGSSDLLDIACGPGYAAGAAAERGANAAGIDFSVQMIRTAARLYPAARFRLANAHELPFDDACFTAVAMNYGIQHFERPARVLAEAQRVLRQGGRIAFTVWGTPQEAQAASIVYAAIKQHGTLQAALPPEPPLWRLATHEDACAVLLDAGFASPVAVRVDQTWRLGSADEFFSAFYEGSVRTKAFLRAQTRPALAAIRRAIDAALKPYARTGGIEIPMGAVLAAAHKARTRH